ncbi:hypothetical protein FDP08_18665 [Marinobacter panjinensis]|uniref:Bacterial virulence factor lipase N-terminal domain-containing protein n=1 Tax=Marinobacter panjinensis TaxID=2576384 RepID=A0A4U6QU80_9GAMM|nr:hypothetical protein [Marinobacter panjinensis]MCR8915202.1 hypothetical protein [Marinobacter panjinensis]TKV64423.1 hypothetical protein FDP08_18665 [Marinobacter panjinensis]
MFKKTLISLAVASSLGLTGCFDSAGSGSSNANPDYKISQDSNSAEYLARFNGKVWPVFDPRPAISALPIPNDLIFGSVGDGSFTIANPDNNPVIAALNGLSGASTTAPIDIQMSGQLDDLDPTTLAQNVFLLETVYASGEPVRGLAAAEPPTVAGSVPVELEIKRLRTEDGTLTDFVRILPTEPLKPNTRYIVALRKGITADGKPIVSSPQYTVLKDSIQDPNYPEVNDDNTVVGPGLDPIVSLINNLWEPVAAKALLASQNVASPTPEQVEGVRSSIALAYSFTTSNDEKVLTYIANPARWFEDQIKALVTTTAAKKVRGAQLHFLNQLGVEGVPAQPVQTWDLNEDGAVTAADFEPFSSNPPESFMLAGDPNPANFGYADVSLAVQGAVASFVPSKAEGLEALSGALYQAGCDAAPNKFACTGTVVAGAAQSVFGAEFPAPAVQEVDIASSTPAQQRSAVLASVIDEENGFGVTIHEGSITLPYYLGTPVGGDNSPVRNSFWKADNGLAKLLKDEFGFNLAQADASNSTVVNSIFPFPAETTVQTAPVIIMTPKNVTLEMLEDNSSDLRVVIFQHGITTDRSAALGFGSALINKALAEDLIVVAIDQPLHGIAPFSTEDQQELADTLLTAAESSLGSLGSLATPTDDRIAGVIDGTFVVSFTRELAIAFGYTNFTSSQAQELIAVITGQGSSTDGDVLALAVEPTVQQAIGSILAIQGTVARAGSTVPGLDSLDDIPERHFNLATNQVNEVVGMNFDPENAVGESGDLFLNLSGFLNTRDNMRQGAVDLLNLRKTISSWGGVNQNEVYLVGHSLGTVNGTSFLAATEDSGDATLNIAATHLLAPASGFIRMAENSPGFAPAILGGLAQPAPLGAGLTQGDANLETYFNVFQAAIDSTDPINFADNLVDSVATVLLSQISGDRFTIAAAYDGFGTEPWEVPFSVNIGGSFPINSSQAPLSGSLPLAEQLGISGTAFFADYPGGSHGTPVLPIEVKAEAPDFAKFEFDFLKDRTLATGGEVITTQPEAQATFSGMIGATIQTIYTP